MSPGGILRRLRPSVVADSAGRGPPAALCSRRPWPGTTTSPATSRRGRRARDRRLLRPRPDADRRLLGLPAGRRRPDDRAHRPGGPRARPAWPGCASSSASSDFSGFVARGRRHAEGRDRGGDASRSASGSTPSGSPRRCIPRRARSCAPTAAAATPWRWCRRPRATRSSPWRATSASSTCSARGSRCATAASRAAIEPPLCYGEGKLEAARGLAETRGVDLRESFFYTDSDEDLPLLEHVGRPRPTNPNRRLATIAARRGWPSRTFHTRGLPSVTDVVRTSLSVASLGPSLLLGVPAGCSRAAGGR